MPSMTKPKLTLKKKHVGNGIHYITATVTTEISTTALDRSLFALADGAAVYRARCKLYGADWLGGDDFLFTLNDNVYLPGAQIKNTYAVVFDESRQDVF